MTFEWQRGGYAVEETNAAQSPYRLSRLRLQAWRDARRAEPNSPVAPPRPAERTTWRATRRFYEDSHRACRWFPSTRKSRSSSKRRATVHALLRRDGRRRLLAFFQFPSGDREPAATHPRCRKTHRSSYSRMAVGAFDAIVRLREGGSRRMAFERGLDHGFCSLYARDPNGMMASSSSATTPTTQY